MCTLCSIQRGQGQRTSPLSRKPFQPTKDGSNRGDNEACIAALARIHPNEQESIVLLTLSHAVVSGWPSLSSGPDL